MHFKYDNNNDKCRLSFNVNQQKLFKRKKIVNNRNTFELKYLKRQAFKHIYK